jgi:hypothetical protein
MIRSALPIFKGGTKRGRNPLKLLGGAGKMAARGAQAWNARVLPYRPASGALAPVTPKPAGLYEPIAAASSLALSLIASLMTIAPRRRSMRPSRSMALISRDTVSRRVLMREASSD